VKEGLNIKDLFENNKTIGASLLQFGDILSYTLIVSPHTAYYKKNTRIHAYYKQIKNFIGMSDKDYSSGNKERDTLKDLNFDNAKKCALNKYARLNTFYRKRMPGFNQFKILGEMRLMRQYPDVLYEWFTNDPTFKQNNPNYKSIVDYLKTASSRLDTGVKCMERDMLAWNYAYDRALAGTISEHAQYDINFFDTD